MFFDLIEKEIRFHGLALANAFTARMVHEAGAGDTVFTGTVFVVLPANGFPGVGYSHMYPDVRSTLLCKTGRGALCDMETCNIAGIFLQ